jgi:hypothetical protein
MSPVLTSGMIRTSPNLHLFTIILKHVFRVGYAIYKPLTESSSVHHLLDTRRFDLDARRQVSGDCDVKGGFQAYLEPDQRQHHLVLGIISLTLPFLSRLGNKLVHLESPEGQVIR